MEFERCFIDKYNNYPILLLCSTHFRLPRLSYVGNDSMHQVYLNASIIGLARPCCNTWIDEVLLRRNPHWESHHHSLFSMFQMIGDIITGYWKSRRTASKPILRTQTILLDDQIACNEIKRSGFRFR